MKAVKDLRKKSDSQLQKQADSLRLKIASARVDTIVTDNKNTKSMRNMRRELARVLTILNEPRDTSVIDTADKESTKTTSRTTGKDSEKQDKQTSKETK